MASTPRPRRDSSRAKRDNSDRWLLTYSDLITLLLAFFIVMYSMSSSDLQKFTRLADSMRRAFNVGVLQGVQDVGVMDTSTSILREGASTEEGTFDAAPSELDVISEEMGWISREEGLADKVSISIRPEGVAIGISGNLLFSSGRADLRPDSLRVLQSLARVLARLDNSVRIEGHTDDIPPSGASYSSNWELSAARSVAVVRYLSEVEGIDARRLSAAAYSEYQPVAPNDSPRSRGKNRRSEVLILYPSAGAPGVANSAGSLKKEAASASVPH